MRMHPERIRDRIRRGAPCQAIEWPDLLHAHDVDGECPKLAHRKFDPPLEGRLRAPEVERDDAKLSAHGTRNETTAFPLSSAMPTCALSRKAAILPDPSRRLSIVVRSMIHAPFAAVAGREFAIHTIFVPSGENLPVEPGPRLVSLPARMS